MERIGIIGFGNMGECLISGLKNKQPQIRLGVMETVPEKKRKAEEKYGVTVFSTYSDFFDFSEITIICVKPQDLRMLFTQVNGAADGKQIISIAAGSTIDYIRKGLNSKNVIRFMPNLAAQVDHSVVGVAMGSETSDNFRKQALSIATAIGKPYELSEKLMNAVTGLSGSGIAYVFSFIHALALGGTKSGLLYHTALDIAVETVAGAAKILKETGEHPIALLSKVISPAGTTIQGINALEQNRFTATVIEAVEKASERAGELEN